MKKNTYKIVKVPGAKSPQYRQEFVAQPINYLKIIENKEKIKYEHLQKDYEPGVDDKVLEGQHLSFPNPDIQYSIQPSPPPQPPEPSIPHVPQRPQTPPAPVLGLAPQLAPPATTSATTSATTYAPALTEEEFEIPSDSDDDLASSHLFSERQQEPVFMEKPAEVQRSHTPLLTPPHPPPQQQQPQYQSIPFGRTTPSYAANTIQRSRSTTPLLTPPPRTPPQVQVPTPKLTPPQPVQEQSAQVQPVARQQSQKTKTHQLREFLNGSDSDDMSDGDYRMPKRRYVSTPQKEFTKLNKDPPTLRELESRGEYRSRSEFMDVHQIDRMVATLPPQPTERTWQSSTSPTGPDRLAEDDRDRERDREPVAELPKPPSYAHVDDVSGKADKDDDDDESIDEKKRDILISFDMLKKKYPDYTDVVPELNMQTPLKDMKHIYEINLRKIEIDHNANDYRTYLVCGFMFVEHVMSRFFRIDMSGFAQQQMMTMKRYDRFLIEMGEKHYLPTKKKFPVELRLLICIVVNAAIFVVTKQILSSTGSNLLNTFNTIVNNQQQNQQQKRRMKMPDLSVFS